MILSAPEIIRYLKRESTEGNLVINPYSNESQQPASYDLRSAMDILLPRGTCTLVPSLEWVELPPDLAGTLRCRSSFGRRGVLLDNKIIASQICQAERQLSAKSRINKTCT